MSERYDVIIIGAGIGGLTCGCYLAKAGLKVLIVEQHDKPGGYCTSFTRKGYRFDVGVHYFGGIRGGLLNEVLEELNLKEKIEFNQFDPADKIIMPENVTYIRSNIEDTIQELKKSFPAEKNNIDKFFDFIMQKDILGIYAKTRNCTFEQILASFFKDQRLKSTLGVLVLNIGVTPSQCGAFPAIILLLQYSLNPGYYPRGGMQKFPDVLADCFKKNNGRLILSKRVIKIITENDTAQGIMLDNNEKILSNIVVSNVDATKTFTELLNIKSPELNLVNKMEVAPSMFILYLGLEANFVNKIREKCNIFYLDTYNVNSVANLEENILSPNLHWLVCDFPSLHDPDIPAEKSTAIAMVYAPYKSKDFWDKHKKNLSEKIITNVDKLKIIPNFKNLIKLEVIATPYTLYRYTSNKGGSFAGWLPTLKQTEKMFISQETSVENLYLASHWCTTGYIHYGGIPNVIFLGRRAATIILKKLKKKKTLLKN